MDFKENFLCEYKAIIKITRDAIINLLIEIIKKPNNDNNNKMLKTYFIGTLFFFLNAMNL